MSDATLQRSSPLSHLTSLRFSRREVVAGVTIWAVLVPSALAYSGIVGVQPVIGLIGVPFALIGYALLGGSKLLVVGADAAVSVMVASTIAGLPDSTDASTEQAVIALTFCVAGIFLAMRLLRLGWIADLIPEPVLKGFVQGLIWVTVIDQIPKLLDADMGPLDGGVLADLRDIATGLDTTHATSAILGVGAIVALFAQRRWFPNLPAALVVLVGSGIIVAAANLGDRGVPLVGEPAGDLFANAFEIPTDTSLMWSLLPGALAIVLLGFTESLGATQVVAESNGEVVHPNRELLGLGGANLAVGLSGGFAVTGALSKTAVAVTSGARTQAANLVTAALALATALVGRPLFDYLANPVLAAIVIWGMLGMTDFDYLGYLYRASRSEFVVAVVAFVGVLFFGVIPAVVLGTALSLALLARQVARPPVSELGRLADGSWRRLDAHPDASQVDGFLACRIEGPLVFVSSRWCCDQLRIFAAREGVSVVALDTSGVDSVDSTGVHAMIGIDSEFKARNQQLWFIVSNERIWHDSERIASRPLDTVFPTVEAAVQHFEKAQTP